MRVSVLGYSPVMAFIVQGLAKEGHQITYIAPDVDGREDIFNPLFSVRITDRVRRVGAKLVKNRKS